MCLYIDKFFLAKCQEVNTLITEYVNNYVPIHGYNDTIQGWINSGLTGEDVLNNIY